MKMTKAYVICGWVLAMTSLSPAQTTIHWTGNENRWGGGSLTPTENDNFALNSGTGTIYQKVSNGETYHHVYDRNVMAGTNITVSMNRANNTLASLTVHGSSPTNGFVFDTVGANSEGLRLSGNVTVTSGVHVFNNASNNLVTLTANTIWTVADGASLTWRIPLSEFVPGLTLTKSGAGTLLLGGGITVNNTGDLLVSEGVFGGTATLAGNLVFAPGSKLQFSAGDTLTLVSGKQAMFNGPFGIADLAGLDASAALGTYSLINGTVDFSNITNVGPAAAVLLGEGKRAYLENSGGLRLKVVADFPDWPRPTLRWAGFDGGRAVLSLEGLAPASYLIQDSTNLTAWEDVGFLSASSSPALWTNPATASDPLAFYRALMPTAPPAPAANPSPANLATGVSTTTDLHWAAGAGATSHDVYFGTTSPGVFMGNQPGTTFDPGTLSPGTTYYWRVDEKNAAGTTTGSVWSFTTIVAPPAPASSPSPTNLATGVSTTTTLTWATGAGATSHDVYFGTTSPGVFMGNQADTTFDPGTLSASTTYYWRVDEKNAGGTTPGEVWSFTTMGSLPAPAANPLPTNLATGVNIATDLTWTAGASATSHDVYFGTTSPGVFMGNQPGTTFDPGTLSHGTTYYWRVDEKNAAGTTTGSVWAFTTDNRPAPAANPSPANLATGVSTTANLAWTAGAGATSHDVYFGPAGAMIFKGNQTATTFDPGTLDHNTTYQWRIDGKNASGTTTGTVWTFTTQVRPAGVTYVGAGSVASGTGPITPSLPAGLVTGDLLVLFLETVGDNISVANGDSNLNPSNNGGTWLSVARGTASPQATGSGTDAVRLTAYYSRYNGTQGPPITSDSGDHQLGRIVAFRGVVASGVPWDVVAGGTEAASDTSGSIPGTVTTVSNTLIVVAMAAALPDASGTSNFSGWSNSGGMANLTERTDNTTSAGNGGALGIATADFAPAGMAYGNVNVTLATASFKAMMSVALKPEVPPGQIINAWPTNAAANIGVKAQLRWDAGSRAVSRDVYFGTTSPGAFQGSQIAATFDPGTLSPGTTYYWRVDEKNATGTTPGAVRSFTTSPAGILPQLVGMMLSNATQQLASAGCVVGAITKQFSATVPAGVIIAQTPVAGSACPPGTVVDLVRSRGPEAGVVVFPNGPDFLNGEAIPVHRCVALARTLPGTILAFTENRPNGKDDEDDMDIHLRRSTDGGETWGPVIVVADDSMNPCKNPVPVVLPSGRILMLWLWNAWIPKEADRTTREVYVTYSDDDGLTWAPHTNITSQVYQAGWDWYGMGPGHAFVKTRPPTAGRIIFPSRHGVVGGPGKPHIIYTDDNGATFHLGGELSVGNESTACEQSDGDILFNVRSGPVTDYRYSGISADGGLTFPVQYTDYALKAAGDCQGSLLEHSMNPVTGKANILFSNPDDLALRVNGTVKLSESNGDAGTWVKEFRYSDPYPAFSGYSDIAVINAAGDVGIIWEFGSHYSKPARWDGGVKFRAITFSQISDPVQ